MKTIYNYDFQYLRKGDTRPLDDGEIVRCSSEDNPLLMLPNVGDYVDITNNEDRESFGGKVKSRLFRYTRVSEDHVICNINIVVEEVEDSVWGTLVKE
ncbi:hypothetical protein LGD64_002000 [Escherichia coli]|uniref:Uncharacterized protein n=1 Tax=Escherichia coli TaxID=562 RepID=A0A0A3TV37_ECOLX|nr:MULTISPECIES: hypothetical protein [Enterobacteriaceae]EHY2111123.1 hypothetical protein [Escherichia coli O157]EJT2829080.1 hypothetical protein [Shigella boydii]ANP06360.1 hypothetical protein CP48_04490 [Escherichia coli]EEQ1627642.1 hypothetical protein [Escherichia coli]EEQ3672046.1 hypothetical protein [Escherichia coli]